MWTAHHSCFGACMLCWRNDLICFHIPSCCSLYLVYSPVCNRECRKMFAMALLVDPLPFVPATWTADQAFCGEPRADKSCCMPAYCTEYESARLTRPVNMSRSLSRLPDRSPPVLLCQHYPECLPFRDQQGNPAGRRCRCNSSRQRMKSNGQTASCLRRFCMLCLPASRPDSSCTAVELQDTLASTARNLIETW